MANGTAPMEAVADLRRDIASAGAETAKKASHAPPSRSTSAPFRNRPQAGVNAAGWDLHRHLVGNAVF